METKKFGDLEVGDQIHGVEGSDPVTVTSVYEKHIPDTMFEIEDEDGNTIEVSGNHLWYVETDIDRSHHASRKKELKELFGKLDKSIINKVLAIAEDEKTMETSLIDIISLLDFNPLYADDEGEGIVLSVKDKMLIQKKENAVVRIAESIGHIAENNASYEDALTGEVVDYITMKTYDANRFAQQVLSATGLRKFSKRWPLIVGKVITTERMSEIVGLDGEALNDARVSVHIPNS